MAIHLHIDHDKCKNTDSTVHLIPCKILADAPANVVVHFKSNIRKIDDEYYNSIIRGYPLRGKEMTVPSGYKGITFYEYKNRAIGKVKRNLHCTGMFSKLTYWNYDQDPSKNDAFNAALDWIGIAEAVGHCLKKIYN